MKNALIALFALTLLAACQEEVQIAKPAAVTLTPEAAGHYCQMTVLDHDGPKAQIHLKSYDNPIWFTQVRDAVAFTLSPEEPKDIAVIYVNDMEKAESWAQPGADNWIDAETAWFVTGSKKAGGMGAPEAIPFGSEDGARAFSGEHGGSVLRFTEIPADYVLGAVDVSSAETVTEYDMRGVSQ
ncbi:copper resistance protein CopZ (plasmid) [Roseibium aggregatum]|uniref:nitrous oxide reductase accessory protein NosL n=1 Tax=Roseibium aggregatum TaxID=187304 RepID=UPI001E4D6564|nr:nitrous oxide reductase accessory protein NosL [Roseibium aggregatum]UES59885.1 copper resistance protein CopZ [Roseibium aggregatum]